MSPALAGMRQRWRVPTPLRNITGYSVLFSEKTELAMFPWPIGNFDYLMDDALHIARRIG
jgi:hypothetical protein